MAYPHLRDESVMFGVSRFTNTAANPTRKAAESGRSLRLPSFIVACLDVQ